MKKSLATLLGLLMVCLMSGCSSDNAHQDEPDADAPRDVTINGQIASSIPAFPDFEPVKVDDNVKIHWTDARGTKATLTIGAFGLFVANMNLNVAIGDMVIDDVTFEYVDYPASTVAAVSQPEFECQAGQYETKGSLTGSYDAATGELHLTLEYRPGSMPFTVKSVFDSL